MAIWYCGSEKYTAVTAWAASTAYSVGDIRRPTAAAVGNERVFRCTTAGTSGASEPTWVNTKGATTNDNTVVWTEITGDATYNSPTNFAAPHARMRQAAAWMAAGDSLYVSSGHAATEGAQVVTNFPGTPASPNIVLCIDSATGAVSTGASESSTSANAYFVGGVIYCEGVSFTGETGNGGTGLVLCYAAASGADQIYKNCTLITGSTNAGAQTRVGRTNVGFPHTAYLINPKFKFTVTTQNFSVAGICRINGGSVLAGGANITAFVGHKASQASIDLVVDGFDFSGWASTLNLVLGGAATQAGVIIFSNCKMPASWSGGLVSSALTNGGLIVEAYNLDAGDTNYRFWFESLGGSVKEETSVVMTGGATDGTTAYSMKMASSASAEFPAISLDSPKIFKRNETTGLSKTVTVEITHSAAAPLTDADIRLEIQYLGTSGFPLSLFANDGPATVLATPADQTTSSQAWGGTAQTYKQKLSVAVTPQEKGDFIGVVKLFKASTTVYVNPDLIVT